MPSKDYMAEYREKNAKYVEINNKRTKARNHALSRLSREYLQRYNEILKEELAKEGIVDA